MRSFCEMFAPGVEASQWTKLDDLEDYVMKLKSPVSGHWFVGTIFGLFIASSFGIQV